MVKPEMEEVFLLNKKQNYTNYFIASAKNNPILFVDALGLACRLIDSFLETDVFDVEKVVYGDWIYDNYLQFNIKCWCFFHREKRIDVTSTFTTYSYKMFECIEKDECEEIKYYKMEVDIIEEVKKWSRYGGKETKKERGTMVGIGKGVESGSGCDCAPRPWNPPPPGLYQG